MPEPASDPQPAVSEKTFTEEDIEILKDALRRCPEGTFEAALAFRQEGDVSQLETIVLGIIKRYLEPDMRSKIDAADDNTHLMEDLGIDSLTMMEIVILVEETLDVSFDNDELREIRTYGDLRTYMARKVGGESDAPQVPQRERISLEDILEVMPHQAPFLFIDQAEVTEEGLIGTYKIRGTEDFLQGHFKNNPVFPASIMVEALGQVGVLFLLKGKHEALTRPVDATKIYFTSSEKVKCQRICKPGDILTMEIKPKRIRRPLAFFEGTITVEGERAVFCESFSLIFDFVAETEENA
ncbi:MAG: phosphopantetheine-binding protein [Opitutales bacterium]|nr:phosphopantetheine-binding protein [Opitutales bacterium]NRA26814.1 FabA-like domain protein [Opitutales bacterium]